MHFYFPLQVGYHIYPAELGPLRHAVRSAASHTYTSIPAPIQYAITDVSIRTLLHPSMNFIILTKSNISCKQNIDNCKSSIHFLYVANYFPGEQLNFG